MDLGQNQPENAVFIFGRNGVLVDLRQRKGTLNVPAAALVVDVGAPGRIVLFGVFTADGQHAVIHIDVNLIARAAGQLGLDQKMVALIAHIDAKRFGPRLMISKRAPEEIVVPEIALGTARNASAVIWNHRHKIPSFSWPAMADSLSLPRRRSKLCANFRRRTPFMKGYDFTMTDRLYYDQTYLTEFDASVTAVHSQGEKWAVSLDRSAFYPTSGGQPFDTGLLNDARVSDVFVDDAGEVWHIVDAPLSAGDTVHGRIDWARRFDHMQQHAGEHMIAGALWRQFRGSTIGLHLGADCSTIDATMPGGETHLTDAQIRALEDDVNGQIQRDVPIRCWFPSAGELKELPLRKPPTVHEHIRVVAIGDCEMVACGGTHPSSAGQIALVKIIGAHPSKGKLRLSFLCGNRAVMDYRARYDVCERAAGLLSAQIGQIPDGVDRLTKQIASLERELDSLRRKGAMTHLKALADQAVTENGYKLIAARLDPLPMDALRRLVSELIERERCVVLLSAPKDGGDTLLFARSASLDADMSALLRQTVAEIGGKGGGRSDFAQGSSPCENAVQRAAAILRAK